MEMYCRQSITKVKPRKWSEQGLRFPPDSTLQLLQKTKGI